MNRYLEDMSFLDLTLVKGRMLPDLKDITNKILGKLSVSVCNLQEDHPSSGLYPVFAHGQELIGMLSVSIRVVFNEKQTSAAKKEDDVMKKKTQCLVPPISSSFEEKKEELVELEQDSSSSLKLPLYLKASHQPPGCLVQNLSVGIKQPPNQSVNPFTKSALKNAFLSVSRIEEDSNNNSKEQESSKVHGSVCKKGIVGHGGKSSKRLIKKSAVSRSGMGAKDTQVEKNLQQQHLGGIANSSDNSKLMASSCDHMKMVKDSEDVELHNMQQVERLRQDEPRILCSSLGKTGFRDSQDVTEVGMFDGLEEILEDNVQLFQSSSSSPPRVGRAGSGCILSLPGRLLPHQQTPSHFLEIPKTRFGFDPGGVLIPDIPSCSLSTVMNKGVIKDTSFSKFLERKDVSSKGDEVAVSACETAALPTDRCAAAAASQQQVLLNDVTCSRPLKCPEQQLSNALKSSKFNQMETNSTRVLPSAYTKDDHPSSPPLKSLQKTLCSNHVGNSGMLLDFLLADDDKDVNCNNKVYTPVTREESPDFEEGEIKARDVAELALLQALFFPDEKDDAVHSSTLFGLHDELENKEEFRHSIQSPEWNKLGMRGRKVGSDFSKAGRLNTDCLLGSMQDVKLGGEESHCPIPSLMMVGQRDDVGKIVDGWCVRVNVGKIVLCNPALRDFVDIVMPIGLSQKLKKTHPVCSCLLTVLFPAIVQPSPEQHICISPVAFATREAIFDHQSQLCWKLLPNDAKTLEHWRTQNLRVMVALSWQHEFETLECTGSILLENVVRSMPSTYQTSLGLTILHHDPHPHSRTSNNSTWGQWRRNHGKHILERSKSLHTTCNSSTIGGTSQGRCLGQKTCQKNLGGESPVARIEIALQLSYGDSTAHRQKDNQVDLWLYVNLRDINGCLSKAVNHSQAHCLLLVVKSGPRFVHRVPFPYLGWHRWCHKFAAKGSSDAVVQAPPKLENSVLFIEVWYDQGWKNENLQEGLEDLVGLIKIPLRITNITSSCEAQHQCKEGQEVVVVVAKGYFPVQDPIRYVVCGEVQVIVMLGMEYQLRRLQQESRAAIIIQWHVRDFLRRKSCMSKKTLKIRETRISRGKRQGDEKHRFLSSVAMVQHVVQLFVWQAIGLPALDSLHFSCGRAFIKYLFPGEDEALFTQVRKTFNLPLTLVRKLPSVHLNDGNPELVVQVNYSSYKLGAECLLHGTIFDNQEWFLEDMPLQAELEIKIIRATYWKVCGFASVLA
ncbi:unnamed protein product [Sphagnum tenellum]